MVVEETPFFKSLWDLACQMCGSAQVPLYVERHDPKVFTTVQKLFLCIYQRKKKLTLRGLIDDLASSKVVEYLGLRRLPNFSTLSYFLKNLSQSILDGLDDAIQKILPAFQSVIVDSTGFECTFPSHYYCHRRNSAYPVDGFITAFIAIDQEQGYVRAHITRARKVHDSKMLKPLLKKCAHHATTPLKIVYGDRGFDSEENYRFTIENLNATPLILQKNMLKPLHKCKGIYRREIREIFDYGEYLKRNKIESVNASIKRKYGSTVTTKKIQTQRKEITLKIILYNLEKKIRTIFIIKLRLNTFQQNQ